MNAMSPDAQATATRAEICRHALDLFAHYGFQKTNIGDIAARCEMSPGNLYRFFKNKQGIGVAVVRGYFDLIEAAMDLALMKAGDDPETRIRIFIETGVAHLVDELERTPKIVELAEFVCEDGDGLAMLNEHIRWKRERLAREIANGAASGHLKALDPEPTAAALLNALKAFSMPMTLAHWMDRSTILPELRAILDVMFAGISADTNEKR